MDVDAILAAMNQRDVRYLIIGGMNFMLRHRPLLTYDIDFWVEDTEENRHKCGQALANLDAEWGSTEENWAPVSKLPADWLGEQAIYCLNSPHGAIDIMRVVEGLDSWQESWQRGIDEKTKAGTPYRGLSDDDMLKCQLALAEPQRNLERVRILQEILQSGDQQT